MTQSLVRIATYEDRLNAAITINPRALAEADERDRERRAGRIRGPLHGIPIALKDNIHTTDMPTTGGALAFAQLVPPYEATLTKNLRDAGAIIIAKTVHDRAGELGQRAHADQLQLARRLWLQPLRSSTRSARRRGRPARASDGRLELRHRHRRQLLGRERRHRDLGIDSQPVEPDDAGGDQADGWTYQPLRGDSDCGRSGHARTDGEVGHRRRNPARRARERIARSS